MSAGRIESVDPKTLIPHAEMRMWRRPHHGEEYRTLKEAVISSGTINKPIEICGLGCASAPGTVIDGWARVQLAVDLGHSTVPVLVLDELSVNDERDALMIGSLLPDQFRSLRELEVALAEQSLRDLHEEEEQDARADGRQSVGAFDSGRLASVRAEKPSKLAARKIVFFHHLSSPELKAAVDARQVPLTTAASKLRELASDLRRGVTTNQQLAIELSVWLGRRIASPPKRGRPRRD